jgi:hypothetical protein
MKRQHITRSSGINPPTFLTLIKKLNNLQTYSNCTKLSNCRPTKRGSVLAPTKLQNFAPSPYLKDFSNNIIIQIKIVGMSTILHSTKLHSSKRNSSWVVCTEQNMNFKFHPPPTFVLLVFHKNGLIKSCSSFEHLSPYKISWSQVYWYKFCNHLRSFVRCFGTIEASELKRSPLYWIQYKSTNWFRSY